MNSVCKDLYMVLCAVRWSGWTWQSPFWILAFACTVARNCQNTSQNACHGCEKRKKNRTRSEFFYDGWKFRRQCVNVIDITWGRIYFQRAMTFSLRKRQRTRVLVRGFISSVKCEAIDSMQAVHLSDDWQRCCFSLSFPHLFSDTPVFMSVAHYLTLTCSSQFRNASVFHNYIWIL